MATCIALLENQVQLKNRSFPTGKTSLPDLDKV